MREYFGQRPFPCARGITLPKIRVTALSDREDLVELTGRSVAGFFDREPVSWLEPELVIHAGDSEERAVRIFNHELAHRFVALCYPRAPIWLNEGIAELFETVRLVGPDRVQLGVAPYVFGDTWGYDHRAIATLVVPRATVPSFSTLRSFDYQGFHASESPHEHQQTVHYATAWSAVHLLEIGDPRLHQRFGRYLSALRRTELPEDLLWQRFFAGANLDAAVRRYQASPTFRFTYDEVEPSRAPAPVVRHLSQADAHLVWAELFLRQGRREATLDHLHRARSIRGESARAALLRGTMAWMARRPARAGEHFERAIEIDPTMRVARHARVRAALESGTTGPALTELVESLRRDGMRAEDLALVAAARIATGRFDEAVTLAGAAIRQNRHCWRCLEVLGRAYVGLGRPDRAVGPLQTALALLSHHAGSERRVVERALRRARVQTRGGLRSD